MAYTPKPSPQPYVPAAVVVGDGPVALQSVDPSTLGKAEPGRDVFGEHPHQEIKSDGAAQVENPAQGQPQASPPPPEQLIKDEKVDKDISAVGQPLTDAETSSSSSVEESSTASSEVESSTSSQVEESQPAVPLGVQMEDEAEADKVRQELFGDN